YNAGTMTMVNSTLWQNSAVETEGGGGIYNAGSLTLNNNTLASNWQHNLYNAAAGTLSMTNTILANSHGDCANDGGNITLNDHNLIEWENLDFDNSCGGTNLVTDDPGLIATAGDNGGPTWTLAPPPGSPAIDAGDDSSCETVDQRGIARPQYTHCDLGAFELENYPPTDISLTNNSIDENQPSGTLVGTLSTTDPDSGDAHVYNLQSGVFGCSSSGNSSFQISGDELQSAVVFDYETPPTSFNICLRSTDSGGGTYDEQFTIDINDLDDTPPELITILRFNPATSPTAADALVFRATFDEDVQDVDTTDFAVDGSTTAAVTGVASVDPSTYDVTVSGGDLASFNGTVGLDLASGQDISDLAGNPLPDSEPATDEVYLLDNAGPFLTAFSRQTPAASPTNADILVFRASFNEDVQYVDINDFYVGGATTAIVSGVTAVDASTYDVTVSGGDLASFNGLVGLNLDLAQDIADLLDNPLADGEPATDETYLVDNTTSSVISILRQVPSGSPTNLPSVTFRVTFDEDVQSVDPGDFTLTLSGTATGTVNSVNTISASVYDVIITGVGGDGLLNLDFAPANDIADLGGNPLGASPAIGSEETYTIDTTSPTLVFGTASVPPFDGATLNTRPSTLVVQFNEAVQSGGGPGTADSPANYLLLQPGPNGIFDTLVVDTSIICDPAHPVAGDDIKVDFLTITYSAADLTATLQVDPAFTPLATGIYRLYLCGGASIDDLAGNPLNGGANSEVNFRVRILLPETGFTPYQVTRIPEMPADRAYSASGLTLEIPRLGLKADILGVPNLDGSWETAWLGSDIGWLQGTAFPTWAGNSVLTGHVYDANGLPGPFVNLSQLKYGDRIIIQAWGQGYIYEVQGTAQVQPENTAAALGHEEYPWLTLITCRGYDEMTDSYRYRLVVKAVQVEIQ
ncbi:MAG: sortase, partial [Anaerolineae bacterium]|nr:sortase [Anaerolineae bacterium]